MHMLLLPLIVHTRFPVCDRTGFTVYLVSDVRSSHIILCCFIRTVHHTRNSRQEVYIRGHIQNENLITEFRVMSRFFIYR